MKAKLLLILLFLGICDLMAQSIYVPGKVTKGKTAAYYCRALSKLLLEVRNINNVDTIGKMYYHDGRAVPDEVELKGVVNIQPEDLLRIFQEVLTPKEWNKLKGKDSYSLRFTVVANSQGDTKEIIFRYRNTDPVMTTLSPDRLYQLEQKLKNVLKIEPSKSDSLIRNIRYIQSISYRDIKK